MSARPCLRVELLEDRFVPAATVTDVYVTAQYQTTLARNPEPAGLKHWADFAVYSYSRPEAAAGINLSPESVWQEVRTGYQAAVGRPATTAETLAWDHFLRTESYATVANVEANIWGLREAIGNDTDGWIDRLYREGPGRPATAGEIFEALGQLFRGEAPSHVAYDILTSPQGLDHALNVEFLRVFGRPPGQEEAVALRPQVPQGFGVLAIRSALSNSDLFWNKLQNYARSVPAGVDLNDPVAVAADFRTRVGGLGEAPPPGDEFGGGRTLDGLPPPQSTRGYFFNAYAADAPFCAVVVSERGVFAYTRPVDASPNTGLSGAGDSALTASRLQGIGTPPRLGYVLSSRQTSGIYRIGPGPELTDLRLEFIYFPVSDTARVSFTRADGSPVGADVTTFELLRSF